LCHWFGTVQSGRSVHSGVELQECLVWLCRRTALHLASLNGHTETALALVEAGADVHCKDNDGYGSLFLGCMLVALVWHSVGADGPSTRGGAAGVPCLAVQVDGAARRFSQRPHGDGDGAGEGGRGRALQDQQRVRFSPGCILVWMLCHSARRTDRPLGVELRECLVWLCRRTALHLACVNGHPETAMALVKAGADVHCKANDGYGSRAASSCRVVGVTQCGADGPSTRGG
jgi:hypothetical protein